MLTARRPDLGPPLAQRGEAARFDLLRFRPLSGFLASPFYPLAFQLPLLAAFALLILFGFFGTIRGGQNLATVATWGLWWPLLPVSLLLVSRAWCAICPLAAVASLVQKVRPATARAPAWLRQRGVWLMSLTFLLLTWADRIWGVTASPRASATMLLVLLLGAVGASLIYQRRVWCRYLCPVGALTGLYAMASVVELRARPAICRPCRGKDCYTGNERAPGCPLLEFPQTLESNRNCNLCASCLKSCPHDSLQLRLRLPGRELWGLRRPLRGEAFLAVILVAVVYLQTIDMTFAWGDYMKWLLESTRVLSYNVAFTLTFLAVVTLTLGLFLLAAWTSGRLGQESWRRNFARFGYAYLALALAGHLAHNLSHLVGESPRTIQTILDQLRVPLTLFVLVERPEIMVTAADPLALAIVAVGGLGSLYAAWRVGRAGAGWAAALPHLLLLLLLCGLYVQMFLLPMNPRHAH